MRSKLLRLQSSLLYTRVCPSPSAYCGFLCEWIVFTAYVENPEKYGLQEKAPDAAEAAVDEHPDEDPPEQSTKFAEVFQGDASEEKGPSPSAKADGGAHAAADSGVCLISSVEETATEKGDHAATEKGAPEEREANEANETS